MKKTAKIVLIVCSIALVLFLLLPFLETSSPKTSSAADTETAKAQPQIFTSNPLTELVGRIARFFRTRQNAEEKAGAQENERFKTPQEGEFYASAKNAASATPSSVEFSGDTAAYDNAYLQNEEGDWVLIRQTSPAGSTRGMHEINVKDNAYDRYVAQERQARFTPVMRQPAAKEEVPDSRMARIFNPIKRLFGASETPSRSGTLGADGSDSLASARRSSSSGLDKNKEKSAQTFKTRSAGWDGFDNNPFSTLTPGSAEAAQTLANLLDPTYEIDRTAEWLADLRYPNAKEDPRAEEAKQNFLEQLKQQKANQTAREMQELLVRRNGGQGPVNVLQFTLGCGDGSVSKQSCSFSDDADQTPQPDFTAMQKNYGQRFFEQTGHPLPPGGITVILNSSELPILLSEGYDTPEEALEDIEESKQKAAELYLFMQDNCQDNCYWVATGADQNSDLANTIKGVGLTFKGDPFNRYPQYVQDFLNVQRQSGKSEEEIQAIAQQLEENRPHYVAYPQQDIHRLAHNSKDLMKQHGPLEEATVPFFTHVQNAYDFFQRTNYPHPILYGNGSAVNGDKSLDERASDLTDELIQYVNDAQEIRQKAKGEMTEEGAKTMAAPAVKQIQERLKNDLERFTQTNDVGTYQK